MFANDEEQKLPTFDEDYLDQENSQVKEKKGEQELVQSIKQALKNIKN